MQADAGHAGTTASEVQADITHSDDPSAWWRDIDDFLLCLFRQLRKLSDVKFVSPNYVRARQILYLFHHKVISAPKTSSRISPLSVGEETVRHNVFSFRSVIDGLTLSITAELHHENFTLTFATEFPRNGDLKGSSDTARTIAQNFKHLHDLAIGRYNSNHSESLLVEKLSDHDADLVDNCYSAVLGNYHRWCDDIVLTALSEQSHRKDLSIRNCGGLFANFTGVVFGLRADTPGLGGNANREGQASLFTEGRLFPLSQPPRRDNQTRPIPAQVVGSDFRGNPLRLVDSIWPIMRGFHGMSSSKERRKTELYYGKPEYTASLLQKGEVLYISSLGRQIRENGSYTREPVIYTLVVSYTSKWRLGRIIDRINHLGTLRLSALRDLATITSAASDITSLADDISRYALTSNTEDHISSYISRFSKIGKEIEFGLNYRIGRSRYYFSAYRDALRSLRPIEISGYSRYDDFVQRKVFDAYYFIDRVGRRYEELRRQITFVASASQQAEMADLSRVTAGYVEALKAHTTNLVEQSKATKRQTESTNELLSAAELISVFPLTYYVGTITSESTPEAAKFLQQHFSLGEIHAPTERMPYFLLSFTIFALLAFLSWNGRRLKRIASSTNGGLITPTN